MSCSQRLLRSRRACPTGVAWDQFVSRQAAESYSADPSSKYLPLNAELMVEPALGLSTVDLSSVLPPDLALKYDDINQLVPQLAEKRASLRIANRAFCKVLGCHSGFVKYFQRPEVQPL